MLDVFDSWNNHLVRCDKSYLNPPVQLSAVNGELSNLASRALCHNCCATQSVFTPVEPGTDDCTELANRL